MRARSVPELGRCGIGSAEVQRVGCCWLQGRGKFGTMVAKMGTIHGFCHGVCLNLLVRTSADDNELAYGVGAPLC